MLYDKEKLQSIKNKKRLSKQYLDLIYDLESYVIDAAFEQKSTIGAEKQAVKGAEIVAKEMLFCYERSGVYTLISTVLEELGIPKSVKGFRILEECVFEAARLSKASKPYFMSDIYPIVAERFGVTSHNAERLCRYACEYVVPTRNLAVKYPFLEELTHRTVESVTVKELVDVLVHHVVKNCRFHTV